MKLYLELLIGAAVGTGVYVVARHRSASAQQRSAGAPATATHESTETAVPITSDGMLVPEAVPRGVGSGASKEARAEYEQRIAMTTLRNAIITTTSQDMHHRGTDLLACTRDLDLAGTEKLRFAVSVDSSRGSADYGPWRFLEIVDGEALPASFAACAQRALGQGGHLTAAPDVAFPEYRGDVELIYTVPAPQ
jgi:hypothetical protein